MKIQVVKIKPGSKFQKVIEEADGSLTIHLKSLPVDGKANEELLKILSQLFKIKRSQIRIRSGQTSRLKLIQLDVEVS